MFPSKETMRIEYMSDQEGLTLSTIIDEVVALSNSEGGVLYLGVEDNGVVTGAQQYHRDKILLEVKIAENTVPPVTVRVELSSLGNTEDEVHPYVKIEVPKSETIISSADGRTLRRRLRADGEPECVPLYAYQMTSRLTDLKRLDFSAQPVPGATLEDINFNAVSRMRQYIEKSNSGDKALLKLDDLELLKVLELVKEDSDSVVPTLAGLLIAGKKESLEEFVPTAQAVFQVKEGTEIRVNETYTDSLLFIIDQINNAFAPWNSIKEVKIGLLQVKIPTFSHDAFREAVVNAFGHRDYARLGRVRITIDNQGLEISNPGGFIEGVNVDNLLTAEPRGRNPLLMDVLKRIGLAERTGRGIDRIFEGCVEAGKPLPDYSRSTSSVVSLFIARAEPDVSFIEMIDREQERLGHPLSLQTMLVLNLLKYQKRCSIKDIVQSIDITQTEARAIVESLVESGLLETSKSSSGRDYMLSSKLYSMSGENKAYVLQSGIDEIRYGEMILKLAMQQGKVTTGDVMELLRVDRNKAYYELSKLVDDGQLLSCGKGRGSYYKLNTNE